jgi:ribosomal protein L9
MPSIGDSVASLPSPSPASEDGLELPSMDMDTGVRFALFGAVTSEAISKALKDQFDMDIEKNKIVQAEPIKSYGSYTVKAKLGYEVRGNIHVLVVEG